MFFKQDPANVAGKRVTRNASGRSVADVELKKIITVLRFARRC